MANARQFMAARTALWRKTGGLAPEYDGPLTFFAEEPNASVQLTAVGAPPEVTLLTSVDGGSTWTPYTVGEAIPLPSVGNTVMFKAGDGGNVRMSTSSSNYHKFVLVGAVAARGNINSLLDGKDYRLVDKIEKIYCYCYMFSDCTSLTTAPELPATTLANSCYRYMFSGCTSLTTAPALPATTLPLSCYFGMFRGCTSLTTEPELPATTLAISCYCEMFRGCTSLTTAPALPATTLLMSCYYGMFRDCTSLTTAPELPATTLVETCYRDMFSGCTSLKTITVRHAAWSPPNATINWVNDVPVVGTFYKPSALPETFGSNNIPTGWTVVNID